ncbi:MAG: class I SAM-dependent methyltransferase [Synechococcus sp.]
MSSSPDHGWFDAVASAYQHCRPRYPDRLFQWLAEQAPAHQCCWDLACGSGQASVGLANWFERVEASDISPAQIAAAPRHPRIRYHVAAAEQSGLADASADAVVVAAAIHWLDVPNVNLEVRRVRRPGGLLAWLGYDPLQGAPPALQGWLDALYYECLSPWWPPQRVHVDQHYNDLPFPTRSLAIPATLRIEVNWTTDQLLGFISTWSALRRAGTQAPKLLDTLREELLALWPHNQTQLPLHLPLMGRWGRME